MVKTKTVHCKVCGHLIGELPQLSTVRVCSQVCKVTLDNDAALKKAKTKPEKKTTTKKTN